MAVVVCSGGTKAGLGHQTCQLQFDVYKWLFQQGKRVFNAKWVPKNVIPPCGFGIFLL